MQQQTALAEVRQTGLAQASFITPENVELIKQAYFRGASDEELKLFIQVCNRMQLDPIAKQIYAIKRYDSTLKKEVFTFQVGIDGYRTVAERSHRYEGQTPPQWCGKDGQWREVWLEDEPPIAARVGVYKSGFREPLYAVAKYSAYVQLTREKVPNSMWQKMPDNQLAKCAEALALRKAFPQDLGGTYIPEELPNQEKVVAGTVLDRQPLQATPKTREQMTARERDLEDIRGYIVALRNLNDELFTGETQEEKTTKLLQAIHAIALERSWQYNTINGLKDLKNEHIGEFAGWLEGRINELQEKALEVEEGDGIPI